MSTGILYSGQIKCNSFDLSSGANTGLFFNCPAGGMYSVVGIGNSGSPSGNKFLNYSSGYGIISSTPILNYFIGSNESHPYATSTSGLNVINFPGANAANCSLQGYPSGDGRLGVSDQISLIIFQKEDSLKYRKGGALRLQAYQMDIANYYESKNDLAGLETYAASLENCNRQSYYILMLHLMNKYYASGDVVSSDRCKAAVLKTDPAEEEVKITVQYFDLMKRNLNGVGFGLSKRDSTELASIARSGTSFARTALVYLQLTYPNYTCSTAITYVPDFSKVNCGSQNLNARKADQADGNGGSLVSAVPNPASDGTVISYLLSDLSAETVIEIHDITTGRAVRYTTLSDEDKAKKSITLSLNGFASGVYSYRLLVNGKIVDTRKLVVIK